MIVEKCPDDTILALARFNLLGAALDNLTHVPGKPWLRAAH